MPRNDFHSDDAWQKAKRDAYLVPLFYAKRQPGRFVLMDKGRLSDFLQRRMAVDTVVQAEDGGAVSIEEKIVRWKGRHYTALCLETDSCTVPGHESPGWMVYGQADYLLYCFEQPCGGLDCLLIDFPALKTWFGPRAESYPVFQMTERNRTRGRTVPIADIQRDVWMRRFPVGMSVAA